MNNKLRAICMAGAAAALLVASLPAMAQGYDGDGYGPPRHHWHHGYDGGGYDHPHHWDHGDGGPRWRHWDHGGRDGWHHHHHWDHDGDY